MEYPMPRLQGKTNRQVGEEEPDPKIVDSFLATLLQVHNVTTEAYERMLELGVARESARFVLPMCTTSTLYMCGSIRSWIHYIQLRTKRDTQEEHRQIALSIKGIFTKQFPNISEALDWSK